MYACFLFPLQSEISSPINSVSSNTNLLELPTEPVLYVIETAELELCLNLPRFDGDTSFEDEFMCPVRLKKGKVCVSMCVFTFENKE